MGSLVQQITTPGATGELNVGRSGNASCVATAVGTSFTAQMQTKIADDWQNVGSSFTAIDTPQFVTGLIPGSAIRVNVTAVVGSVDLALQT